MNASYKKLKTSCVIINHIFGRILNGERCAYAYCISIRRRIGSRYEAVMGFIRSKIGNSHVFSALDSFELYRFWKLNMDQSVGRRFNFQYGA